MGQRLLFLAAQFLLLALGMLPAVVAAAVTFFVVNWLVGPIPAALLAWLVALTVLGVAIWAGVRWLGTRFAHFDLSSELRP
jgi:succinate dehydrogenase/fumarate reductase cytochrome b subunit